MKHLSRVITGGFMGNLVEAYDISICYFLATELARNLLGEQKGKLSIVLTLLFLAYLAKPIGAAILGVLSDRHGRKNVLMGSILIMGLSTVCIGIIPNYNQIGLFSAGLFLTCRMIQSLALGAEFLNSASFLVESGDAQQKGFRGCWPSVGVKAGYLLAALMVEFTTSQQLNWRIPFFLALATTLVGFFVRYKMPESLDYVLYYAYRRKPDVKTLYHHALQFIKQYPFLFLYAFMASFLSVASNFFYYLYIPIYALEHTPLPHHFIVWGNLSALAFVTLLIPFFGWLSDRMDRLTLIRGATLGLMILSYPLMMAIHSSSFGYFLSLQLLIAIPCACYYSTCSVILTELFPLPIRCTALSLIFSIAASLAAGLPPLLSEYLIRVTSSPNSPSFIMMSLASFMLANLHWLKHRYQLRKNNYKSVLMEIYTHHT